MTVNHPQWGNMCEICFEQITVDNAVMDENGDRWDIHAGDCAKQAGIKEARPGSPTAEASDLSPE